MSEPDPFRADAAVVFREMRDHGPGRAVDLVARCFPVEGEMPESTRKALLKRSMRRVLDSIIWMRHQKVTISVIPGEDGSIFALGVVQPSLVVPKVILFEDEKVRNLSIENKAGSKPVVTPKVAQPSDHVSDAMDVWHGG